MLRMHVICHVSGRLLQNLQIESSNLSLSTFALFSGLSHSVTDSISISNSSFLSVVLTKYFILARLLYAGAAAFGFQQDSGFTHPLRKALQDYK